MLEYYPTNMAFKFQAHKVPFFTQRSSDYAADGYPSREVADHWQERSCGVACARMVVGAFLDLEPPLPWELIERMIAHGAYLPGKGWIHAGIATFLSDQYGFTCSRGRAENIADLVELLKDGALVIASVAVGLEGTSKSGHLIVVHGFEDEASQTSLIVHHPSSWASYEWIDRKVPTQHFWNYFSGNVIVCRP